ncbi:MAG: BolA family transcriptional regulator [Neisseriaceae bacterium]|nr:BolA family transcriptional regulator [Neisseriaceae bacterium]
MTSTTTLIELALQTLNPIHLSIQDDSHLHRGHAGAKEGGHFSVDICSPHFIGLNLPARHRLVYSAVGDLMKTHVHALAIKTSIPT